MDLTKPDDFTEDVLIYPIMISLLGCIAAEYEASGLGAVEAVVAPGVQYALEMTDECNPTAWVRLDLAFPSVTIPAQNVTPAAQGTMLMGYTLEVGHVGCIEETNEPRTAIELLDATRRQLAEMAALRRAICKCLFPTERDFILVNYQPFGPEGGVVGGSWQVTIASQP